MKSCKRSSFSSIFFLVLRGSGLQVGLSHLKVLLNFSCELAAGTFCGSDLGMAFCFFEGLLLVIGTSNHNYVFGCFLCKNPTRTGPGQKKKKEKTALCAAALFVGGKAANLVGKVVNRRMKIKVAKLLVESGTRCKLSVHENNGK